MSIGVFGSINMDLIARTPRLPLPGETILGEKFLTLPGGKGANQAISTARLGIHTVFIGRLGTDQFGEILRQNLQKFHVNTDYLNEDINTHSGVALISVSQTGENQIIVIPGANQRINQEEIEQLKSVLNQIKILLLQLEIPLEIVKQAAKLAQESGVKVILDPAPVPSKFPADLYPLIDIITPNEQEASQLVGFPVNNPENGREAGLKLCQMGVKNAVVKLGEKGVICVTEKEIFWNPAFQVNVVDTVACGDAFNGGLAVGLVENLSLKEAVIWGVATGALCATQSGAVMPDRTTLNQFLQQR